MSLAQPHSRLTLPPALHGQLLGFRRHVWTIKLLEAASLAVVAVLLGFFTVLVLDRFWDTPPALRWGILLVMAVGAAILPWYCHRWVWRQRRLEQLARLLSRRLPRVGDQLLGIIELANDEREQARSRTLCEAAIRQVAADAARRNLLDAAPPSRHRLWGGVSLAGLCLAAVLALIIPAAMANTGLRLFAPWRDTPRYTFAAVEPLPPTWVVPHGEPFTLAVGLREGSRWRPRQGEARLGTQPSVLATLLAGRYVFDLPPQIATGPLRLHIGDWQQTVEIVPTLRPELTALAAEITLPAYLQRTESLHSDVRGGRLSVLKGSRVVFTAAAGRPLVSARVDGQPCSPTAGRIITSPIDVEASGDLTFEWQDEHGLTGRAPFTLAIEAIDDASPTLVCEDLPRQKIVLNTDQLNFRVKAQDDFGVKLVGMEWNGFPGAVAESPASGERILAAGGADRLALDAEGTFSADSLGIAPQPIRLRVFVEDYLPGRQRVYSPEYVLYVLDPEQHAVWITEQLSRWHRQSLEVRDRELQLFETNKQLRGLPPAELDLPETRQQIERQAAAERANGRALANLSRAGEQLVREAARNPEFGVGHAEKWAEMLQILKDIAGHRMPSVADLLKEASQAESAAAQSTALGSSSAQTGPKVGEVRAQAAGSSSANQPASQDPQEEAPRVPQIVDIESTQQPAASESKEKPPGEKQSSQPSQGLVSTTLIGGASQEDNSPAESKLQEAVVKQQDLLAEFERVAAELNDVLANLEGSTFVKRLKAAARQQDQIAGRLGEQLEAAFGRTEPLDSARQVLTELARLESEGSSQVSLIMDDLQAYFERRRLLRFKSVLEEMQAQDVVTALRQLGDDLAREQGLSMAQCEYWSDTLDRWAEDLVEAVKGGECQGGKSRGSLPPSVVLEVLQILEGEMHLREETRVAEQARPALEPPRYEGEARKLAERQSGLGERVEKVGQRIRELPDGESEFAWELQMLQDVLALMHETQAILARPETGSPAIAAETEIIELLLQSRRINPKGGGGGGGANIPGGGGEGDTVDSAIALLGSGVNEREVRESRPVTQAVGESGRELPEEFRAGLDEYFHRLESSHDG